MLKNIMDRIRGRKPEQADVISRPVQTSADMPRGGPDRLIDVYDSYGQRLQISLSEWREKVLRPNLESHRDSPDDLYNLIISAMNDQLFADVEVAARRLIEIDPVIERSHTILGITLMKLGQSEEATAILEKAIAQVGRTGTLLTNLAKAQFERGLRAESEKTLWEAVVADPNMDNGVLWWLALQNEKGGEEAYLEGLSSVCALPGSWRPKLWLARHHLEHGDLEQAERIYRSVLESGCFDAEGLMMISGDLGNNGHEAKIIELVLPVYEPHRHSPQAGFNLLEAMIRQNCWQEAEALISRLYALDMPPFKQILDNYAGRIQELRSHATPSHPADVSVTDIRWFSIDRPVWSYGLNQPVWLFRQKPDNCSKIMFYPLGLVGREEAVAKEEQEDDQGRWSRALPLYLAESVHYWSNKAALVNIPVVMGGGPVVFPYEPDGRDICEQVADQVEYLVTGSIARLSAGGERISLKVWHCQTGNRLAEKTIETNLAKDGNQVLELEYWLLKTMDATASEPLDPFYRRPTPDMVPPYLASLGQAFMLSLVHNDIVPKGKIWGERSLIEYPLRMALHWQDYEHLKIFFLSNISKAAGYGSDVVSEYAERTLKLLKDAGEDSMVSRLAPAAWKAFGMRDSFSVRAVQDGSTPYDAWISSLREERV